MWHRFLLSVAVVTLLLAPCFAQSKSGQFDPEPTFEKLEQIIFPKVDAKDVTVVELAAFATRKSKELDREGKGVSVTLKPGLEKVTADTRISISLKDVPMIELVTYFAGLAQLKFEVTPSGVVLVPRGEESAAQQ